MYVQVMYGSTMQGHVQCKLKDIHNANKHALHTFVGKVLHSVSNSFCGTKSHDHWSTKYNVQISPIDFLFETSRQRLQ